MGRGGQGYECSAFIAVVAYVHGACYLRPTARLDSVVRAGDACWADGRSIGTGWRVGDVRAVGGRGWERGIVECSRQARSCDERGKKPAYNQDQKPYSSV